MVEREEFVAKKTIIPPGAIPYAITWVDGRLLFKHRSKWSKALYGICHCSLHPFAITPLDWPRVAMVSTIMIEPIQGYCERKYTCLDFSCPFNRFDKSTYVTDFKDCGSFSLGLPQNIGSKPLWWSVGRWANQWKDEVLKEGGIRWFNSKAKDIGD